MSTPQETRRQYLHEYEPPIWAKTLKNIPQYFINLAHGNTPVDEWKLRHAPEGFKIGIKRDDMTGSTLGGSKVRKLEFLMADVIYQNCDAVITCGSSWSNHCRSVSIAARQLGLKCRLFIYRQRQDSLYGNELLTKLMGSDVTSATFCGHENIYEKMEEYAKQLRANGDSRPYVIPTGGSSYVAMFGYITCFDELIQQNVLEDYTDLFVTSGSTGTAAALAIANYLTGSILKIHAVTVSRDLPSVHAAIQREIDMAGLRNVRSEDIIDVMEGHCDKGYGQSTKEEMDDIVRIAQTTGIVLDPIYTVKTLRRMLVEMKHSPGRFKGKNVLFLHTGGLFNIFHNSIDSYLKDTTTNLDCATK